MLVLSRNVNESVYVTHAGVTFRVVVVDIRHNGKMVRLGFDAPPEVVIERDDIISHEPPRERRETP